MASEYPGLDNLHALELMKEGLLQHLQEELELRVVRD